ncbi:hypothetical protein Bhyg_12314 [Pseudolycoriella hygida]|uniref:Uncharacterized protein n=1 Tax=Pseudolycoriella hygida TaxID=35572 RepID=A0A9Q0MZC1_9DIPT|nr:hypothetical protein Bhyg_12314 [Pseudolycoriella hygida]
MWDECGMHSFEQLLVPKKASELSRSQLIHGRKLNMLDD